MGTHGHEDVPIPEVEASRGVPGVDLWLGGCGGWFNFGVDFCLIILLNLILQPSDPSAGGSYAHSSLFHIQPWHHGCAPQPNPDVGISA